MADKQEMKFFKNKSNRDFIIKELTYLLLIMFLTFILYLLIGKDVIDYLIFRLF